MSESSAQEKPATQPLSAFMPVATIERLREQARLEDRSMSSIIRRAIRRELDEREAEQVES